MWRKTHAPERRGLDRPGALLIFFLIMSDTTDPILSDLRLRLRRLGLRLTPQKQAVWRLFATSGRSFSVSDVCLALCQEGIGQATVYRVINSLHEIGLLHRIHDPTGEHRYLAGPHGHVHHLVCRSCGATCPVKDCDLSTRLTGSSSS